jgi:cytidyltransferase-like protein
VSGDPSGGSLGCVTGRFQPVHDDHLQLFRTALTDCDRLIVGVTNPDPGTRRALPGSDHRHRPDANPFSYYERLVLLTAALAAEGPAAQLPDLVRIVPFDLARPEQWPHYVPLSSAQYVRVYGTWEREKARRLAAGGYRVVEVPGDERTQRTSTAIRAALRAGAGWERLVPPATVEPLRALLAQRREAGVPL